jgi:hypothetical protein
LTIRLRQYLGLCVSTEDESNNWKLPTPFYCLVNEKRFPRTRSKERIDFLAGLWNDAHKIGLERYPGTTHIINVGSYYLHQVGALNRLIEQYETLKEDAIFAGNVWGVKETILPFIKRKSTYDFWGYPSLKNMEWYLFPPRGQFRVSSVAMPCVYPVFAWESYPFHNPDNIGDGIWYNQFVRDSHLPAITDLSIRFYRTKNDSDIVGYRGFYKEGRVLLGSLKRRLFKLRAVD